MNTILTAKGFRHQRLRFYLPDRYVPMPGCINAKAVQYLKDYGYDALVQIIDCESCLVDALYPASMLRGNPEEAKIVVMVEPKVILE